MKVNEFIKRLYRVEKLKRTLPDTIGTKAANFFRANFRKQGFDDNGVKPWQKRKFNKDAGRAILVKSGQLRKSIRVEHANFKSIRIVSDLPYSTVHNNGERSGRGKGFKMPQRQFIGESHNLNKIIKDTIEKAIYKALTGK